MSKTTNNNDTNLKKGNWTPTENAALLKAVTNKSEKTTMNSIFDQFGITHQRAASNVAQHYYQLIRKESTVGDKPAPKMQKQQTKQNKNTPTEITGMVNKIKKMPHQAIRSLSYIVNSMQIQ